MDSSSLSFFGQGWRKNERRRRTTYSDVKVISKDTGHTSDGLHFATIIEPRKHQQLPSMARRTMVSRNNNKNVVAAVAATAALLVVLALFGGISPFSSSRGGDGTSLRSSTSDLTTTLSGLQYKTTQKGRGLSPSKGQTVEAHYTGWLQGFNKGPAFDSSRTRQEPFRFRVGAGEVIQGWDESFATMQVGERRQLIIPSKLGYGSRGAGGLIPGGATLYFDVELLSIK